MKPDTNIGGKITADNEVFKEYPPSAPPRALASRKRWRLSRKGIGAPESDRQLR